MKNNKTQSQELTHPTGNFIFTNKLLAVLLPNASSSQTATFDAGPTATLSFQYIKQHLVIWNEEIKCHIN